jgi:hypothetical protein
VQTVIKLKTSLGDDPKMAMRYEWFRDLHGLSHDAAVAHALVKAIDLYIAENTQPLLKSLKERTAEILRTDFGIEESL